MNSTVLVVLLLLCTAVSFAQQSQPTPPATSPAPDAPTEPKPQREAQTPRERMDDTKRYAILGRIAGELRAKGARFLLATQEADGGWASQTGPGVTALCARALIREPGVGPSHPAVQRAVALVLKSQRDDGGIYSAEGLLKNYETSVSVSMLTALGDAERAAQVARAVEFLKQNQWDDGESIDEKNPWYGGAGYGRGERPDLSNLQLMLDALHDSGLPPSDPAYQKALVFIQRCQMYGERNDQAFAKGSTQGGFIYSPAHQGESKAGTIEVGGRSELRCYGSMTYAGFKSMLYAGLTKEDPRVAAALDWIRRHWTLDANPNMPDAQSHEGLFYYYHTFARALAAWRENVITDHVGREHDWRQELVDKLRALQKDDGSWINDQDRWMEGLPALTTAYAMLALQEAFVPAAP